MRNPEDCPQTMWSAILEDLERSASLDESRTQMEVLISMLSSCSNGSLAQEMSVFSMWGVVTQTLCALTVLRNSVGTMRQKMETLSEEGYSEKTVSVQERWSELAINGMLLRWRQVETSFLRCAQNWSRGHFAAPLAHLRPTLTGDTGLSPTRTNILANWNLMRLQHESLVIGLRQMCSETELSEVSASLRSRIHSQLGYDLRSAMASHDRPSASLRDARTPRC